MAKRRMMSKDIIDTDLFLDMSPTAQNLYFYFLLKADDDGFIASPKKIMKMLGTNEDDLKVLLAKKFLIRFESGVVVIRHWKIHNYIRQDRYTKTQNIEEKAQLSEKEGVYEEWSTSGQPVVTTGKVRLGKDSIDISSDDDEKTDEISSLVVGQSPEEKEKSSAKKENSGAVIKLFELVNPSFALFYKRKTEHDASKRLLEMMSFQEIEAIVNLLPEINSNTYAKGKSISPSQLEKNLGWIKASIQKDNSSKILEL